MSLNERFCQLQVFSNSDNVSVSDLNDNVSVSDVNDNLHSQCQLLQSLLCKPNVSTVDLVVNDSPQLSNSANSDIDGTSLFDELHTLSNILPETVNSPLEVLRYIHATRLQECVPNVSTSLRILLTVLITVASGERSFSKPKLIKTFLRSTMSQDRLNVLALLSIETDIASSINYADLLSVFASLKACKIIL